jgi:hypothetical protein
MPSEITAPLATDVLVAILRLSRPQELAASLESGQPASDQRLFTEPPISCSLPGAFGAVPQHATLQDILVAEFERYDS